MKLWLANLWLRPGGGDCAVLTVLILVCLQLRAGSEVVNGSSSGQPEEVTLAEAIRRIAFQASLDLVYADHLLSGVEVRFHEADGGYRLLLAQVLAGTDITFKINQQQRLVLFRDSEAGGRKISGYVIAARGGGAVVGARIYLPGTRRMTRTDATGAFELVGVPQEYQRIEVVAIGLAQRDLELGDLAETDILVILNQAMEMNENLRVYAPKRARLTISPLTGRLSLTAHESFQEGPPGWDLFDSLKELPGVNVGTGEPGLEFRGGQPSENLVLLDGIQLFQFDHALGSFSALNADAIGEIEVFKGGYPANYGDRISGVLSLTTREDVFEQREIRFGIDRDKTDVTFLSPIGSKLAVLLSARSSLGEEISNSAYDRSFESTFNRDGLLEENEVGIRNSRDIGFSDFIGKIAWRPTLADKVNFTIFSGKDEVNEFLSLEYIFDEIFNKDGELTNNGASLNWSRLWSANLETKVLFTNSRYESFFKTQELDWDAWLARYEVNRELPRSPYDYLESRIASRLEDNSVEIEASWQVHPNHQLRFGLSKSEKEVAQRETVWYDEPREFYQETDLTSGFLQDHWQVNTWFSSLLGVRLVRNALTNTRFTEPRVSFQITPAKSWSLRGSWGKYNQHLLRSPDNLNYFFGIETWFLAFDQLEPGRSIHTQLGAAWHQNEWSVDLEFFRRDQQGALFRVFEPISRNFQVHQSKDRIRGLDLLIRRHRGQFSAFLGYSYQDAKVLEDITFGIPRLHPTDRNRPHQIQLAFNYSRGPWRTVLAWRLASGLPYSVPEIGLFTNEEGQLRRRLLPSLTPNDRRLPNSHQLDARIQYSFVWHRIHGNLGLFLFNVYDRTNPLYRYYTLEDESILPVDVPGFGFRPSIRLQLVH